MKINEDKARAELLRQHSKHVTNYSKFLRRKILKYTIHIYICVKITADVIHKTENFVGGIDLAIYND